MTRPPVADPAPASPRVPCPLRGGASIDLERCLTCAYFKGSTACGKDARELLFAGPEWWQLLVR